MKGYADKIRPIPSKENTPDTLRKLSDFSLLKGFRSFLYCLVNETNGNMKKIYEKRIKKHSNFLCFNFLVL
jgi:hypothetical protein